MKVLNQKVLYYPDHRMVGKGHFRCFICIFNACHNFNGLRSSTQFMRHSGVKSSNFEKLFVWEFLAHLPKQAILLIVKINRFSYKDQSIASVWLDQ